MKVPVKHPEWLLMYERFKELPFNSIITYKELDACLVRGRIQDDRRGVLQRFRREMLRGNQKFLQNIPNQGYRIIKPSEHINVGVNCVKQAKRRLSKSVEVVINVAYEQLTEREQTVINMFASRLQNLEAATMGELTAVKKLSINYRLPSTPRK